MDKRDRELKQIMAEDRSRGRTRPVRAVTLEQKRRIREVARRLDDPYCDKRQFAAVIREDFGLSDESPEFLQYMKVWDEHRDR
jgi:hypothetical protein